MLAGSMFHYGVIKRVKYPSYGINSDLLSDMNVIPNLSSIHPTFMPKANITLMAVLIAPLKSFIISFAIKSTLRTPMSDLVILWILKSSSFTF